MVGRELWILSRARLLYPPVVLRGSKGERHGSASMLGQLICLLFICTVPIYFTLLVVS